MHWWPQDGSMHRATIVLAVLALLTAQPCAAAGTIEFPAAAADDPAALSRAMPALAKSLEAVYAATDRRAYLDNLFRLQLVGGDNAQAGETLAALHRFDDLSSPWAATNYAHYRIYGRAKVLEAAGVPLGEALRRSFRAFVDPLDDRRAALVTRRFEIGLQPVQDDLRTALQRRRGKHDISLADGLALVRAYQLARMYEAFAAQVPSLIAADDRRRYVVDKDRLITMADGARICTLIVRPRSARKRLTALMQFSIYGDRMANLSEARRTASNGYVGVEALTRGKGCSPDAPVPYEHDGSDAAAVIGWISRQPWSDGRVGMYGGSYNSFAQWAAAKRRPPALKALMPAVSNAPGIDTPMEDNVFQSWQYYWPFYAVAGKWLNASSAGDASHWIALQKRWYVSGTAYRAMDRIDGRPNPIWDRWISHPSYDAYWQRLIPYRAEFARISIPVLTVDGYLDGQNVGGLYYVEQYHKYNPRAESYFVVGPYDHVRGQRGTVSTQGRDLDAVAGFPIDPAAHLDIGELRYQRFDYVFKGARKPALLRDRVNYEVMGANVWKHAASVDGMHGRMLRFHFGTTKIGGAYGLVERGSPAGGSITLQVDLADRTDVDRVPPASGLDTYLASPFESAPLERSLDMTGVFSGRLDFVTNKKDFDFNLGVYELTAKGAYVPITYYQARASYVGDRAHRRLLTPGRRTRLDFRASRLTSWRLHAGSRLVLVLGIVKDPGIQVNFGTGKDVSDETVADGRTPLRVTWFGGSFVDIPASR